MATTAPTTSDPAQYVAMISGLWCFGNRTKVIPEASVSLFPLPSHLTSNLSGTESPMMTFVVLSELDQAVPDTIWLSFVIKSALTFGSRSKCDSSTTPRNWNTIGTPTPDFGLTSTLHENGASLCRYNWNKWYISSSNLTVHSICSSRPYFNASGLAVSWHLRKSA
ncbi:hypothetical protein KL907_003589 [Ogataea polymorpha]|nr:hypothetical protein KL907_003589 [Ogataea polymorpha]